MRKFKYSLDYTTTEYYYLKYVVNFTILFTVISVSILAFIDICMCESARFYPEDQDYRNATADFPESPQSARAAFGPPESWMKWVELGFQHEEGGGSYVGIQSQDPQMPFVFWGGGQNGIYKYIGRYTFICPGKAIPPQLGLEKVYEGSGQRNGLDSFDYFPFFVTLKVSDSTTLNCRATPSEWYGNVRLSKQFQERWATLMDGWKRHSDRIGYRILPGTGELSILKCFKLTQETSPDSFVYTVDIAGIGDNLSGNEIWYEDKDIRKASLRFEVPIEIRNYWKELKEDDVNYIFSVYGFGTYLILNNGLYLRKID